jgi:hypothetical protein
MKRIVAAAAFVLLAAAGCATTANGTPPEPVQPITHAGFAGYKWSVVAIGHDGKQTPIPAHYSVYLQFTPNGQFGANEPINYHGGTYRQTADGFVTSDVYTSLVGYEGKDPVVLLSQDAISAFNDGVGATTTVTGDRLTVTVAGYTLTCQRDGAQANFPPAKPT